VSKAEGALPCLLTGGKVSCIRIHHQDKLVLATAAFSRSTMSSHHCRVYSVLRRKLAKCNIPLLKACDPMESRRKGDTQDVCPYSAVQLSGILQSLSAQKVRYISSKVSRAVAMARSTLCTVFNRSFRSTRSQTID
jgi:AraC-like DNA-binding protein